MRKKLHGEDQKEGANSQRERDEDRGLLDRAKDAVMGSEEEEESRRREGTDRPERR